ncbi:MAG: hypothetical protein NZZ41_08170, partial [Candidatus Dojkabacteria bacterium]|nr:hypothetical protein [Candidatus Dojkabacteria bacterium]
ALSRFEETTRKGTVIRNTQSIRQSIVSNEERQIGKKSCFIKHKTRILKNSQISKRRYEKQKWKVPNNKEFFGNYLPSLPLPLPPPSPPPPPPFPKSWPKRRVVSR